jgi:hypothetical protein
MAEQTQLLPHRLHTTFISLRNPHSRIYFAAQIGSNIGVWIQITAENWLASAAATTAGIWWKYENRKSRLDRAARAGWRALPMVMSENGQNTDDHVRKWPD